MRALVTGAAGFIGRHVARELARRGHTVDGIGRGAFADRAAWGVAAWREAEVGAGTLPDATYDAIVHCAGGSSVGWSFAEPHGDFTTTVPPFAALLEWMRTGPSRHARLVLVSSAAVYGAQSVQPIGEAAPLRPISPYGAHKLACEELARTYARSYGLIVAVVRLFSIYGAGLERQLLWDACHQARRGRRQFAGKGSEQRDWLHVRDACDLLAVAADHASPDAPVINGGSGTGTRVAAVVTALFAELGIAEPPEFDGSSRAGDPPDYVADVGRATALGWRPTTSLATGLADYARWFRARA